MENRTLEGAVIMEVGEAQGWGFHIEESFLDDFVSFVNEEKDGKLRSNFGHNWDNMGLQLGTYAKFRKDGSDKVRADLTILKAADSSPVLPGIGSYILQMAQEAPDQIMNSIVFQPKYHYQYDEDGKEVVMQDFDWWTGTFSNQIQGEKVYAKFGEAYSSDMVDEGAVTNTLFHRPKFKQMSDKTEKKTFLQKIQDQITALTSKIDALGANQDEEHEDQEEIANETLAEATEESTEETQEEATPSVEELQALTDQITQLTNRLNDIEENTPATFHAGGKSAGGDQSDESEDPIWLSDPINQKAMSRFSKKDKK